MPLSFDDKEVERLLHQMYSSGFTQEGVNEIYKRLGLGAAPVVPAGLLGNRPGAGRAGGMIIDANGRRVGTRTGDIGNFLNTFGTQALDPNREYGVGNYLGLAGLVAGAAGALSGAGAAAAPTGSTAAGSNLGVFANGGTGGLAGVGGGNAGALAASGAITGGAGTGGTVAGALGGASGLANALSGVGGSMGWDWGSVLEYGVPILGGLLEREGSKDAARASAQASQAAIDEQRRQYDTTRADLQPWMTAGTNALSQLQNPAASFSASPDYAFRRAEGNRGIENSFAARGGAASGNALRALNEFNSNLASGEFGNWWNRQAGLAGVGQAATTNVNNFGANSANNIGSLLQNQGNARASGIEGSTNAGTNTLANLLAIWQRRNGSTLGA